MPLFSKTNLNLNDSKKKALERIMKVQKDNADWNFYHERQHVENLFYNRFNFFLMLYGMIVAAAATMEKTCEPVCCSNVVIGLLVCGIIILSLVWLTLLRNCQTLNIILRIINSLPSYHSSPILSKYMDENSKLIPSKTLMSCIIPFCCILSLAVYLVYILQVRCGIINVNCCTVCIILLVIILLLVIKLFVKKDEKLEMITSVIDHLNKQRRRRRKKKRKIFPHT